MNVTAAVVKIGLADEVIVIVGVPGTTVSVTDALAVV